MNNWIRQDAPELFSGLNDGVNQQVCNYYPDLKPLPIDWYFPFVLNLNFKTKFSYYVRTNLYIHVSVSLLDVLVPYINIDLINSKLNIYFISNLEYYVNKEPLVSFYWIFYIFLRFFHIGLFLGWYHNLILLFLNSFLSTQIH